MALSPSLWIRQACQILFGSRERLPLAWTEPGETCEVDHEGADDAAVFEPNASNLDLVFG